jgi:hypothetical protein
MNCAFLSTYVQWRIADKDAGYRKVTEKQETIWKTCMIEAKHLLQTCFLITIVL